MKQASRLLVMAMGAALVMGVVVCGCDVSGGGGAADSTGVGEGTDVDDTTGPDDGTEPGEEPVEWPPRGAPRIVAPFSEPDPTPVFTMDLWHLSPPTVSEPYLEPHTRVLFDGDERGIHGYYPYMVYNDYIIKKVSEEPYKSQDMRKFFYADLAQNRTYVVGALVYGMRLSLFRYQYLQGPWVYFQMEKIFDIEGVDDLTCEDHILGGFDILGRRLLLRKDPGVPIPRPCEDFYGGCGTFLFKYSPFDPFMVLICTVMERTALSHNYVFVADQSTGKIVHYLLTPPDAYATGAYSGDLNIHPFDAAYDILLYEYVPFDEHSALGIGDPQRLLVWHWQTGTLLWEHEHHEFPWVPRPDSAGWVYYTKEVELEGSTRKLLYMHNVYTGETRYVELPFRYVKYPMLLNPDGSLVAMEVSNDGESWTTMVWDRLSGLVSRLTDREFVSEKWILPGEGVPRHLVMMEYRTQWTWYTLEKDLYAAGVLNSDGHVTAGRQPKQWR